MRNPKTHSAGALMLASALLLAFATTLKADYPTTVSGFSPVGYWRFNETASSPAMNLATNSGSVGAAGDGYVLGNVSKAVSGKVGNCMQLNNDGTIGSVFGKVDVPYNSSLSSNAPFTIEFWCKPTAMGVNDVNNAGYCPLSCFDPNGFGGGNRSGWLFYMLPLAQSGNAGRFTLRMGLTSGYAVILDSTNNFATLNNWSHVVATYDGTTARIYVNGVIAGASAVGAGWLPNTKMALRMGGTSLTGGESDGPGISNTGISGNRGFPGALDEVAVYGSVLSATRIKVHYDVANTNAANYPTQVATDSPRGYWRMEDAVVSAPPASALPIAANIGSATSADATNGWGSLANQAGPSGAGFGVGNKAVFYNGESGFSDVPDSASLHFSGPITMMAWVKLGSTDFFRDVLARGWDGNYAETFLRVSRASGGDFYGDGYNTYYEVGTSDGTTYTAVYYPIPSGDIGQWVFLAGSYDGANWNLYRNGVLVSTGASANGSFDTTNRWCIGARSRDETISDVTADGIFFSGSIDEPAIFNTALSAANIQTIYNDAQMPPVFTRRLASQSGNLFAGDTISNDFWAEGSGSLSYLWLSNGVIVSGATLTNISLLLNSSGALTLAAVASNAYGSATNSVTYNVLTPTPPSITTQPGSITRYIGFPFTLSVAASGSPVLKYQWNTNGVPIPGATNPSYSSVVSATYNFTCVVTNNFGRQTSSVATVTAVTVPGGYAGRVISSNPIAFYRLNETSGSTAVDLVGGRNGTYFNATLNEPGYAPAVDPDPAASFGAVDSHVGSIPGCFTWGATTHTNFTIELWAKGPAGQGDESTLVSRGIGSTGTTATEQFGLDVAAGVYRFFTRGGGNSIYECNATIGPNDTWQHIVCVYDDLNTTGGGALGMQIYVNGTLSGTGSGRPSGVRASADPVSIGAKRLGNNPAYDGYFTGTIDEVAFYGYAMDAAGAQAHYAAAYGPSTPPVIDIQPQSKTNYLGLPITLTVTAHGTAPMTYQWKKNGVDISGANNYNYVITAAALSDIGSYTVGITNGVNPGVLSSAAYVDVLALPTTDVAIPGLVIHLPFDGNLTDTTGRGNNGTAVSLVTNVSSVLQSNTGPSYAIYSTPGAIGASGLHFETVDTSGGNGASWSNRYVSLGNRADLHFSSNANFTVAFWVKYDGGGSGFAADFGDLPFLCTAPGSTFGNGLVFAWTYGYGNTPWIGGWAFSVFDLNGAGVGGRGDQGTIDDGNWHHLVHVFDRANGNVNYLDGKPAKFNKQAGTNAKNAQNVDTGQWFTIGQDPTGLYGEPGQGALDDIGIWKRALTPLEAASLYAAGVGGHSFTDAPFTLKYQVVGGNIVLTWDVGVLQQASSVEGPYTDMGNLSPLTVSPSGSKFYRIRL